MKIKAQDPSLPDGYEIALTGLNGLLINNKEVEIDDEEVKAYEAKTGKKLADVVKHSKRFGGTPKRKPRTHTEDVVEVVEQTEGGAK